MEDGPVDLIITGGTLVNESWSGPATVCVTGDLVSHVLEPGRPHPSQHSGTQLLDATGQLVIPGGVDPHTHIRMSMGEYTTLDGYAEATIAALWGGTTTVVDFAIPTPSQSPLAAVTARREAAVAGRCDTALHGCVIDWSEDTPRQLREMAEGGVRTIKMFTTYRDVVMAEPETILHVMQILRDVGGLVYVHAEANHLVEDSQERMARNTQISARYHAKTRSELSELSAVHEVLLIAEELDVPVYFVHQSTPAAIDLVREARRRGVRAYTETCPHYLTLTDELYGGSHPELYVCCPPLRSPETVSDVLQRALNGSVDTIGSDHCCYDTRQKQEDAFDVRIMPNGLPGVETRIPVLYTELVQRHKLSPERFVAMTSTNAARLNGLYPRKGVIAQGSDADIVILDPDHVRTVRAVDLHMVSDYNPYEGRRLTGWPTSVVSRGRIVVADGRFSDPGPVGEALAAEPIDQHALIC